MPSESLTQSFLNRHRVLTLCILLSGVFLIFFRITRGDVVSDDAHYAFRSIDYVDFLSSQNQTTPLQWFGKIPGWSRLSFHDAPPFAFLAQHTSMVLFGVNTFAARLPSATAGVVSLLLTYLIAKELYSRPVGLLSMMLLAANTYFIWISRIGYLEGVELGCILGAIYGFLKSKTDSRWLYLWGFCLGLSFLTKYTSFYLIPVFIVWILWQRRELFRREHVKRFLVSLGIVIVLCAPVIIYNIQMLRTRGHFDMQFAILFGQSMADWPIIERSVGTGFFTNISNTFVTLSNSVSIPVMVAFIASLLYLCSEMIRRRVSAHVPVIVNVLFLTLLFALIAPTNRYLPLYTPFIAIAIGYGCWKLWSTVRSSNLGTVVVHRAIRFACVVVFALFISVQAVYAVNTNHAYQPIGDSSYFYAPIRVENRGFGELDTYVSALLSGTRSARPISFSDYHNIPAALKRAEQMYSDERLKPFASLIMYDENMNWFGRLWVLERWLKTHFVPVLSIENTLKQARDIRGQYLAAGVNSVYFVVPVGRNAMPKSEQKHDDLASPLLRHLEQNSMQPIRMIRNSDGEESFVIYFIEPLWEILDVVFPEQTKR